VTSPEGNATTYSYDASDRVTRSRGITPGSASITDFHYLYTNSAGKDTALRQAVTGVSGITTGYAYDALDRLLSATLKNSSGTVKTYGYGYDKNGNRTTATVDGATTTAAFNGADQLCWTASGSPASPTCGSPAAGATTYTYDANGNQTGSTTPSGAGTATTYNSLDQATTITPTAQAPYAVTYAGTTQNQRLTYTDTAGSTTRTFTNTNSVPGITARTGTNPGTTDGYTRDTTGHLLTARTGSARSEYLTDGLGSVAAVANPDGTVDHTYAYDPYGVTTSSLQRRDLRHQPLPVHQRTPGQQHPPLPDRRPHSQLQPRPLDPDRPLRPRNQHLPLRRRQSDKQSRPLWSVQWRSSCRSG